MAVNDDMHEYVKAVFVTAIGVAILGIIIGVVTASKIGVIFGFTFGSAGVVAIFGGIGYFNKKKKGG